MTSLKKSASFRSRIPIRKTRIPIRRCYSPQPTSSIASSSITIQNKSNRNSGGGGAGTAGGGHHQKIWNSNSMNYSSTSYTSSDESEDSEPTHQNRLKQLNANDITRAFNISTDAISLDGLLDSISCGGGSFSNPPSPINLIDSTKKLPSSELYSSSYDSFDKYKYTSETLKLTDNYDKQIRRKNIKTIRNYDNCKLRMRPTQTICKAEDEYAATKTDDNIKEIKTNSIIIQQTIYPTRPPLPPPPPSLFSSSSSRKIQYDNQQQQQQQQSELPNSTSLITASDNIEMEKQRLLSDWYYIKSIPKPKQTTSPVKSHRHHHNHQHCHHLQHQNNHTIDLNEEGMVNTYENTNIKKEGCCWTQEIVNNNNNNFNLKRDDNINMQFKNEIESRRRIFIVDNEISNKKLDTKNIQHFCKSQSIEEKNDEHLFIRNGQLLLNENYKNNSTSLIEKNCHYPEENYYVNICENFNNNIKLSVSSSPLFIGSEVVTSNSFEHINNVGGDVDDHDSKNIIQANNIPLAMKFQRSNTSFLNVNNSNMDINDKYLAAKCRPTPVLPTTVSSIDREKLYPPKSTSSYRSDCELSGSYVSLECPSPPGPPACLTDSRRDPQARLSRFLKEYYTELSLKEPILPQWAQPTTPGALCPAKLEPELRLHSQSHGTNECITVDQILTSFQTKDGAHLEAPRRVLIECPPWAGRHTLSLRILHAWTREAPWPTRGTPVALALFISLTELKKSFSHYLEKELLPKGTQNPFANGFGGFNSAWNSLTALGPKLLIILDAYDSPRGSPKRNCKNGKNMPTDVINLFEGKLFPDARIIIISVTHNITDILPLMQRHIKYEGLTWGRSASLLGGGQWGAPSRLLDTVQQCKHLRTIARTPLGCLALATIYENCGGDLLLNDELDIIESVMNCVAPDSSQINVAELGRLALFSLKTKRSAVTSSEIRMYCSFPESSILGCLDRELLFGRTAKKRNEHFFTPICPNIAEFLAANYLSSLANRPGLLAAEITGLSLSDEVEPEILKVLTFSMGILSCRAHILLSKLTPLWLSPQTVFSLSLAGGDSPSNLNALCDLLGISKTPSISPLETNPIWVQIRTTPNELFGWAMALRSPNCTLKNLELNYQLEKNPIQLDSRNGIDVFLDALSINESVSTLRISSLIENDVKECEINLIATCVSRALLKPRLENFELILTLLEEDPPILKLQSVVTALCRSIPRQNKLGSLLLDLSLCTSQLVQICSTLEKCSHVTRLSLPHLRCERGAIGALASLLNTRPLAFLALPSCWGARDDPPSSSGVSMGSGSGSSTGTSGLIKQSSLTGAPSPRSYPTGIFSSLPRGILAPTALMGRSATLPRQPLDFPADKRSSDSVVSKTWYPTPACDGGPHNSGTLHDLLLAAREPYTRLNGLDLSKAQLSLEDSMCLGETIRLSPTLHSIKLEGSSRLSEILPTILGAGESHCLQMLTLASPRLAMEDGAIAMSARALANCVTLRLLCLDGWSFRIESSTTLSAVRAFLSFTSVRELGISNCRLHLPTINLDNIPNQEFECRSIVVLKMSGAQVLLADNNILRGPQLLPYLGKFPCLREIDISAPARSGLASSSSAPFILDDKCLIGFFQLLHTQFSMLNTLKICNWILHLDDSHKTLKIVSKYLRNSPLSHIKTDGISVMDRPKKLRIEPQFLQMLLSSLPNCRWLGISLAGKKDEQIMAIGNAVLELKGFEIDIRLSESTIENARLLSQAIGLDGKFDIRVSTFGTSTGILVHAEKTGAKNSYRKHNKD